MRTTSIAVAAAAMALSASTAAAASPLPSGIIAGSVQVAEYDGVTDDLLSAGLNQAGLEGGAPGFADPLHPTVAELRRRAIYENYRGIVDPVPAGGMGSLWGPASGAPAFDPPVVPGLIPGVEYKALMRGRGSGGNLNRVPVAVQIPRHFDASKPCILIAPPSGSRGYYGGIAVAEWGLFKGCATVLPGKGTGTGFHLLGTDTVYDIDGIAGSAADIGDGAQFRVRDSKRLRDFLAAHPDRVATKHAHSTDNSEASWGAFALTGTEFALWALNDHFDTKTFKPNTTVVIASGVSNGAGTALRALEADRGRLIDGLVVTEPSINPRKGRFVIRFGDTVFDPSGLTLYDTITLMGTYAGCAGLDASLAGTPFFGAQPIGAPADALQNRCAALRQRGLLTADTLAEQAAEALAILNANGYDAAQNWGIASHEWLNLWRSLQPTYAASYGRFTVDDHVCGISFAATGAGGVPVPVPAATAASLFATSSGIPATAGINLVADEAANGPILEQLAISNSTGLADLNFDGALCFRFLSTGERGLLDGVGRGKAIAEHNRVKAGGRQLQTTGNLGDVPAIVIHGRQDALVFPNYQSRAYYALNQQTRGRTSKLVYWEVTPAQHFDAFLSTFWPVPPFAGPVEFVPLHYYLTQGLDMMYAHLTAGTPLPPSQVVRATARGLAPLTAANAPVLMPPPVQNPGADAITFADGVLDIPQ
ncbi:MAG: 3-hydroxybutyrate oligomer hydrolase family protein [Rhodospirillales bacterium]